MPKPDTEEEQFCSRCNAWGPAELMQPLCRFPDLGGVGPWLWLHHHCAEIYSKTQFQAAMKRFETQVHSMAKSQPGGSVVDITKARARINLAAAADRATRALQALRRAKATLEIANIRPDDAPQADSAKSGDCEGWGK